MYDINDILCIWTSRIFPRRFQDHKALWKESLSNETTLDVLESGGRLSRCRWQSTWHAISSKHRLTEANVRRSSTYSAIFTNISPGHRLIQLAGWRGRTTVTSRQTPVYAGDGDDGGESDESALVDDSQTPALPSLMNKSGRLASKS